MATVDKELIEAGKTERGSWRREQLAILGVSWPPRKGWKARLEILRPVISDADARRFLELREKPRRVRAAAPTLDLGDL